MSAAVRRWAEPLLWRWTYGRRRTARNHRGRVFSPPLHHPRDLSRMTPGASAPRARFAPRNPPTQVLRCASAGTVRRPGSVH